MPVLAGRQRKRLEAGILRRLGQNSHHLGSVLAPPRWMPGQAAEAHEEDASSMAPVAPRSKRKGRSIEVMKKKK